MTIPWTVVLCTRKPVCCSGDVSKSAKAKMFGLLIESNLKHLLGVIEFEYSLVLRLFITEADRLRKV